MAFLSGSYNMDHFINHNNEKKAVQKKCLCNKTYKTQKSKTKNSKGMVKTKQIKYHYIPKQPLNSEDATRSILGDIAQSQLQKPKFIDGKMVKIIPFSSPSTSDLSFRDNPQTIENSQSLIADVNKSSSSFQNLKKKFEKNFLEDPTITSKQASTFTKIKTKKRGAEQLGNEIEQSSPKKPKTSDKSIDVDICDVFTNSQEQNFYSTNETTVSNPSIQNQSTTVNSSTQGYIEDNNPSMKDLYTKMVEIDQRLDETHKLLKRLFKKKRMTSASKPSCLPFKTLEELRQFENAGQDLYDEVVDYLKYMGTINLRSTAKNFIELAFELSEEVLMQIKWCTSYEVKRPSSSKINLSKHLFGQACEEAVSDIPGMVEEVTKNNFDLKMELALKSRQQEWRRKKKSNEAKLNLTMGRQSEEEGNMSSEDGKGNTTSEDEAESVRYVEESSDSA